MRKLTHDDLLQQFHLLRSDPQKYLTLTSEFIRQHPDTPDGYFSRHWAWGRIGRQDLALADLNKVLGLEKNPVSFRERGMVLRRLGEYRKALNDFDRSESLDPKGFVESWGPLFRADCHARLGNEEAALADCARLADDHWTPGLHGAPRGNKHEVIAEIRRLAATARTRSS